MLRKIGNFLLAILVFVAALATMLFFQLGAVFGCGFAGMSMEESIPITVFAGHIGFILVFGLWYGLGLKKVRYAKQSVKKVATLRNLGGIVVLSVGMAFFLSFGLALVDPYIPEHIIEAYLKIMEEAQLGESLVTNLAGCLLAPIGEELIFRGVTLYFLMKIIKGSKHEKAVFWIVNLLQAVAFGAFHMNLYQGMYATVLGLLIGFMAYKSNTVLVPILIHMVYNTSQIVLMDPIASALPENTVLYALLTAAGFVVMVAGMCIVKFPKEEPVKEDVAA